MPSEETRSLRHNRALTDIVRARFGFPTEDYPTFRTHVNVPHPTMAVQGPDGAIRYPDIVVTEFPHNTAKIVAEVETDDTASAESALQKWSPYSQLGVPFYLYVPLEVIDQAKRLLKEHRIKVAGLRSWRHIVGQRDIDIVNISDSHPIEFALMPGPVLRFVMRTLLQRKTPTIA